MKDKKIFYGISVIVILAIGFGLLTSSNSQKGPKPFIETIEPSEGSEGSEIVIYGDNFTSENDIAFKYSNQEGRRYPKGYMTGVSSPDGKTITLIIPEGLGACPYTQLKENEACPLIGLSLPVGITEISVINKNGESNAVEFTFINP